MQSPLANQFQLSWMPVVAQSSSLDQAAVLVHWRGLAKEKRCGSAVDDFFDLHPAIEVGVAPEDARTVHGPIGFNPRMPN